MKGICCTCQEPHEVRSAAPARGWLNDPPNNNHDADTQVMADHTPSFTGRPCDGTGTTPQAIVKDPPH